jgi:hypothetical protein
MLNGKARFIVVVCLLGWLVSGCDLFTALARNAPPPTFGLTFQHAIVSNTGTGDFSVPGVGSSTTCAPGLLRRLQIARIVQIPVPQHDALLRCATTLFDADLGAPGTVARLRNIYDETGQKIGERIEFTVFGPSSGQVQMVDAKTIVDVTHMRKVTQGTMTIELSDGLIFSCNQQTAGDPWDASPTPSGQFLEMRLTARDSALNTMRARFQCIANQTTPGVGDPPMMMVMDGELFLEY